MAAAGPVQRRHQVTGDAFVQRVTGHEFDQLPDEVLVAAGGQVGGDTQVQRDATSVFQACGEPVPNRTGADVGQRGASPQPERFAQQDSSAGRVRRRSRGSKEALEAVASPQAPGRRQRRTPRRAAAANRRPTRTFRRWHWLPGPNAAAGRRRSAPRLEHCPVYCRPTAARRSATWAPAARHRVEGWPGRSVPAGELPPAAGRGRRPPLGPRGDNPQKVTLRHGSGSEGSKESLLESRTVGGRSHSAYPLFSRTAADSPHSGVPEGSLVARW